MITHEQWTIKFFCSTTIYTYRHTERKPVNSTHNFHLIFTQQRLCFVVLCVVTQPVTQPCLTLCDPMNCSPSDTCVHGILLARIMKWFALPSTRDLPQPGIKSRSPALQVDSLPSEPPGKPPTETRYYKSLTYHKRIRLWN